MAPLVACILFLAVTFFAPTFFASLTFFTFFHTDFLAVGDLLGPMDLVAPIATTPTEVVTLC